MKTHLASLTELVTEQVNPNTVAIDTMSSEEIVRLMNEEDHLVAEAVQRETANIARAVDLIVTQLQKGGRLIYHGAGTSGRLGMLDALECPPTFGVSPDRVIFILAGGTESFVRGIEGAEDDGEAGKNDFLAVRPTPDDCLVAISASGRTPYSLAALKEAKRRGIPRITLACNSPAAISQFADVAIEIECGPEVLVGSTRLKAGTAQKMVLNMLSTASMIRMGKVYQNLMVDVQPINVKLRERAKRMVMMATGVTEEEAVRALDAASWHTKTAIVMLLTGESVETAKERLDACGGFVRKAVKQRER